MNDCTDAAHPCRTIQHGVDEAQAGDTVSVGPGTFLEAVAITRVSVTLSGSTTSATKIINSVDEPAVTVYAEVPDLAATLQHLTLTRSPVGLWAESATVTVRDCHLDYNGDGLGLYKGSVTMSASTVDHNTLGVHLGGRDLSPGTVEGTLTMSGTTVSNNATSGIYTAGGSTTHITDTSIAHNTTGGIYAAGTLTLTSSTVSDNGYMGIESFGEVLIDRSSIVSNVGAGIKLADGRITNSTITGTRPHATDKYRLPHPAGVVVSSSRSVPLSGTIVANNGVADCAGPIVDGGYNLSSDTKNTCNFSAAAHGLIRTNPHLLALADNGGPTRTVLPAADSPARDVIPLGSAGCLAGALDQRGVSRPLPIGGRCDIGSVEPKPGPVVFHPATLPHGIVGLDYRVTLTATGGGEPARAWSLAAGSTLPAGLSLTSTGRVLGRPLTAGRYKVAIVLNLKVDKQYTIVIETRATPTGSGSDALAVGGTRAGMLTGLGATAVSLGALLLLSTWLAGRRRPARVPRPPTSRQ